MNQNSIFSVKNCQKIAASILKSNRQRLGLTSNQIASYLTYSSDFELELFENNKQRPKGYQLGEILLFYRTMMNEEEILFFNLSRHIHPKILSKKFYAFYL